MIYKLNCCYKCKKEIGIERPLLLINKEWFCFNCLIENTSILKQVKDYWKKIILLTKYTYFELKSNKLKKLLTYLNIEF